jgi:hypothetical protein
MNSKARSVVAVLAAGAILAAFGWAAEKVVSSVWQAGPMTIDGVAQEWDTSEPITDEASQVQYALRNDGRNLYIIMVFRAPQPGARRIFPKSTLEYTGMKIYFTTAAKKSKDYGILFQKRQYTADALIASMEKRGQTVSEAEKAEIRKKPTHIVFTEEVLKPKNAPVPTGEAGQSDPPMFRAIDKGPLSVCEFRIPLNRVAALGGIDAKPGDRILVGFEWGGMTAQIMRDMVAGRSDGSVSARDAGSQVSGAGTITMDSMSGGEGGEIRGMGGGVGEMGRDPRYQKHAFWISAQLAAEK